MRLLRSASASAALLPTAALAQEAAPASETSVFVFNTLLLVFCGMIAMLAPAGFCLLEAGLARSRNAASTCLKSIAAAAVSGVMFWLIGYHLIYGVEAGGFLGQFAMWAPSDIDPVGSGVASSAEFFFRLAFAAMAASIVARALDERVKFSSFIIFTAILTGLIYPIAASWEWGKGYLDADWKFIDVAGASLVHSVGGWAAPSGALIAGPRRGKFHGRRVTPPPGSNLPLAAFGVFVLWVAWFGFNGGSHPAGGAIGDAIAVATIIVNTNMAAAGGVIAAIIMTSMIYKRVNLAIVLSGAIGGLVSISADPLSPAIWQAVLIGAMGGVIVTVGAPLLDRFKIDDLVGAAPAHLFCGIWGTLVVPWTNSDASILGQVVGVLTIGVFAFGMSALVWTALRFSIGVRVTAEQETQGLDLTELGVEAYPEFGKS